MRVEKQQTAQKQHYCVSQRIKHTINIKQPINCKQEKELKLRKLKNMLLKSPLANLKNGSTM